MARASVGPVERLLNMLGEQRACAAVYAGAFVLNLVLCVVLIPRIGVDGAAVATATALIVESVLLFGSPSAGSASTFSSGAAPRARTSHARSASSILSSRMARRLPRSNRSRRNGARSPPARSSPTCSTSPAFALAAAPVFGADAGAVLVRTAAGRLAGLFPGADRALARRAAAMLVGWTHPFAPLGTPLVDRDEPEAVIAAWLDHLGRDPAMPALLLLPLVPEQGAFARGARRGADAQRPPPAQPSAAIERALLAPGAQREGYLERAMSAGKRKELRRQRRRLEDIAPVTFATTPDAADIEAALKDFLVLEASGWKGLAGTAIVNDPGDHDFRAAARSRALAADGQARIDRLLAQRHRHRRHRDACAAATPPGAGRSPTTRGSPALRPACSWCAISPTACSRSRSRCASIPAPAAGHPMIDHVWRERLALSDRLIALRPSAMPFALACRIETLRRSAIAAAKAARDRIRGR